ncbi:MAG: hypothetical protein H7Z14_08410 [Anaerolineae bacterium]|nr:hypothetical protein [Phycisphaerae bacterium]
MRNLNVLFLITVVTVMQVCAAARASDLYGITESSVPGLYQINQTSGAATLVSTTTIGPKDLASDTRPGSFRMWAVNGSNQLYTVNPTTGSATIVGSMGVGGGYMESLAFDATTNTLFGMSSIQRLYSINQTMGAATLIGDAHGFSPFLALACDNNGTLYGVKNDGLGPRLVEINRNTGAVAVERQLDLYPADIAFRPEDNVMFGIVNGAQAVGAHGIYTINPTTGAMTLVGPLGATVPRMPGLAFGPVPEPSSLSSFALVAAAFIRAQARRA